MNKEDLKLCKQKILKCLTEDFEHGRNKKTGAPLKRKKKNWPIFDKSDGYAVYSRTDLEMVMEAVVLGLYFALEDSKDKSTVSLKKLIDFPTTGEIYPPFERGK